MWLLETQNPSIWEGIRERASQRARLLQSRARAASWFAAISVFVVQAINKHIAYHFKTRQSTSVLFPHHGKDPKTKTCFMWGLKTNPGAGRGPQPAGL